MRKNPTMSKIAPDPGPIEGVDNLPMPMGVGMKSLASAEKMPEVNMTPNDGTQDNVPTPAFANGMDCRHYSGGPSSPSAPGKTGAN